jgi:hypothetical protein
VFQRRPPPSPIEFGATRSEDPWEVPITTEHPIPTGHGDPTALLPWIDEPLHIGADSNANTMSSNLPARLPHQNWDGLTRATIQEHWAPGTVELPKDVVAGLDDAWRRTEKDGYEHGGNVLRDGNKSSVRYTGNGGTHAFDPDTTKTDGKTLVGTYHTHPLEPGHTDDTFSGRDLANMTEAGRRISLQRAGDNTHMLARTREFERMLDAAENPDDFANMMEQEWEREYTQALAKDPKNHSAALESATRKTAAKYHLLYYSGQGDKLSRINNPPVKK